MLFPRIKRNDAEVIYGIFKNFETSPAVDGDVVRARHSTDSASAAFGVEFLFCATAAVAGDIPLGVVSGSIGAGEFGKVQVYGYHGNVKATTGTALTAAVTSATTRSAANAADANYDPKALLGYFIKAISSGRAGVFIKCM